MAGKDFGGRMSVRLSSGGLLSIRSTLNIMSSTISVETVTNSNGSMDRTATPVSPEADVNFSDTDVSADDLLNAPRQNVVFTEEFTGVTHHFIDAVFAGRASSNRMTGEVTGLRIVGETYRRTKS